MSNDGFVQLELLKNAVGDVCDEIEPQSFSHNLALHCLSKYTSVVKGTCDLNTQAA